MDKGKFGEDYTANYLEKNGYNIVKRNYHSRYGEIDIIAANEEFIIFVEVKTRASTCNENPSVFVDVKKQNKIVKTAYSFFVKLNDNSHLLSLQPRFDVSAIVIDEKNTTKIVRFDYFVNSFYANYNF